MAAIKGHAAEAYSQVVPAPTASEEFEVGAELRGARKAKLFTSLSNSDTITYKVVSMDDPSKWEVGVATYDSTNETLDRSDANVLASSNSNNRVNFQNSDGSGTVLVIGYAPIITVAALTDSTGGTAGDTIANLADGSTYANDHAAIENNFASLTAKVNALIAALQ